MFTTFSDFAPYVVILTVIICGVILFRARKDDLKNIDVIIALFGTLMGLGITFINLVYSNHYMITLGPILTLVCSLYIKFRNQLVNNEPGGIIPVKIKNVKVLEIVFWLCLALTLIIYYIAPPYNRPITFFIGIAVCVAILCLEILSMKLNSNVLISFMMVKIFLIALILRASAFFISQYPIGSDPWAHADYINNFLSFGHLQIIDYPRGSGAEDKTYLQYPIMHLFAVASSLISNINVKLSMFIVGALLVFASIFIYLMVINIFNNKNLGLLAVLLLNFSDFYIQWSVQVIAMTFGIVLYIIIFYMIVKNYYKYNNIYIILASTFIFIIIFTHTVSSFISLISLSTIFIAGIAYPIIYKKPKNEALLSMGLILFFAILLIVKWAGPTVVTPSSTSFMSNVVSGLDTSLSSDAQILGRTEVQYASERQIESVLDIVGFLIYIALGIIGCIYCTSKKHESKIIISIIMMILVLFFIFFAFPMIGLRNIVPYRWPSFIYTSLVAFSGLGLIIVIRNIKINVIKTVAIFSLITLCVFFMITNFVTNADSAIYNKNTVNKVYWKDSEMDICEKVVEVYSGRVYSDQGTNIRPFKSYLAYFNSSAYPVDYDGNIDWKKFQNSIVIWNIDSLEESIGALYISGGDVSIEPGIEFKNNLDSRLNSIIDVGNAKAYYG